MSEAFFEQPILNSPYAYPQRHWELDKTGQPHRYRPDFVVRVDDSHGDDDLLTRWVPGVNRLGTHGRWALAEFTDVWQMQDDFAEQVQQAFDTMLHNVGAAA